MKNKLLILLLTIIYSQYSYEGLLMPNSTYDLVSGKSEYLLLQKFMFDKKKNSVFSSSFISFPKDINITSLYYNQKLFSNYYNYLNLNIINYGEFEDSESNYNFSAKDIILKNNTTKMIVDSLYLCIGLNYINSHIADYTSSAFTIKTALSYHFKNFLFTSSINNYGFIINKYSNFDESLPTYSNISLMYLPKYINSSIFINYDFFDSYNIYNIFLELFLTKNYTISIGYNSLAYKLYSDNFNANFFTGISLGFNINHKDYMINFGIKNLGTIGVIQAITFNKSFN